MGLRVISSKSFTTNSSASTSTTHALDANVSGGSLAQPLMVEKSGNSPESSGYLPVKTMLRIQPLDTPVHIKLGNVSNLTATVDDLIVSPNNPVFFEFQDKASVPTYIASFCEGTSKVFNVAWVSRDNE